MDYLTDALGSVVTTVVNGAVQNTYRWAGYGQQVSKTGTSPDPMFLWVGAWGYRVRTSKYVRARHYSGQHGKWISSDPTWPLEPLYEYVRVNPSTSIDTSGYSIHVEGECPCFTCNDPHRQVPGHNPMKDMVKRTCEKLRKCWFGPACKKDIIDCVNLKAPGKGEQIFKCVVAKCNAGASKADVKCGGFGCWGTKCGYASWGCNITICSNVESKFCGWKCPDSFLHVGPYWAECHRPKCDTEHTLVHELGHCCGTGSHMFGNTLPDDFEACWIGSRFT